VELPAARIRRVLAHKATGYTASVAGVALVALLLWPLYQHVRGVTAAAALLMLVLLVAIKWGVGPALLSSVLSSVVINYYFVPPILHYELPLPQGEDLMALVGFLVISIAVGQLSARAQQRARENQQLYRQLREAFQQASQLEAVRQSDKLKSALLDTVTHDLRTPLTSIKAAASALLEGEAIPASGTSMGEQERFLRIIVQQSDRLNHFIEGMLELAKVETGSLDAHGVAIPVEDIVSAAVARADDLVSRHHVAVECSEGLLASVSPKAISQVVFSLLENAARYSPPAGQIKIGACEAGGMLQISVDDDGPGIPAELKLRIFEKFFRQSAEPGAGGLGLGLAIARGIVEAHGGRIWVESNPNGRGGSRFIFVIPGAVSEADAPIDAD
jgi:two-component system sensor histidine kinase KdpD